MFKWLKNLFRGKGFARKAWLKALRSGEFQQTTGVLKNTFGHCCLGVGCEVYQREVGGLDIEVTNYGTTFDGQRTVLPPKVAKWLNVTQAGNLQGHAMSSLIGCNDQGSMDFKAIADVIETETLTPYTESK